MLKLLRKRFPHESKIECHLLDGKGLSHIADHSVDRAFSWGVFVHLQHWDIYNYLKELKRVLKPGGRALIHHPNTFSELGWKHFLAEVPASLNQPKLPTTFSLFTPEIMKEFVRRVGLILVDCLTDVIKRDGISLILSPEN
jgi:ubiquinone/menaquinone biosynthesis C-methylase UbiE